MKTIEKFAKIMEADIKSKVGNLAQEQEIYTDKDYIKNTIEEYIEENELQEIKVNLENKKSMLNFINIEIIKYVKNEF